MLLAWEAAERSVSSLTGVFGVRDEIEVSAAPTVEGLSDTVSFAAVVSARVEVERKFLVDARPPISTRIPDSGSSRAISRSARTASRSGSAAARRRPHVDGQVGPGPRPRRGGDRHRRARLPLGCSTHPRGAGWSRAASWSPLGEGLTAEVDDYAERLAGLMTAEVEFPSVEASAALTRRGGSAPRSRATAQREPDTRLHRRRAVGSGGRVRRARGGDGRSPSWSAPVPRAQVVRGSARSAPEKLERLVAKRAQARLPAPLARRRPRGGASARRARGRSVARAPRVVTRSETRLRGADRSAADARPDGEALGDRRRTRAHAASTPSAAGPR